LFLYNSTSVYLKSANTIIIELLIYLLHSIYLLSYLKSRILRGLSI